MYDLNGPKRDDAVRCLLTNRWIKEEEPARWCQELKGWVHPKGEEEIMKAWEEKRLDTNVLYGIIFADWQSRDPDQSKYCDDW